MTARRRVLLAGATGYTQNPGGESILEPGLPLLARIDLANTVIHAPRDGQISEASVRVGQYVAAGSQLLFLVPDTLWVVANYKEGQTWGMAIGQPATFSVDAFQGQVLRGLLGSLLVTVPGVAESKPMSWLLPTRPTIGAAAAGSAAAATRVAAVRARPRPRGADVPRSRVGRDVLACCIVE